MMYIGRIKIQIYWSQKEQKDTNLYFKLLFFFSFLTIRFRFALCLITLIDIIEFRKSLSKDTIHTIPYIVSNKYQLNNKRTTAAARGLSHVGLKGRNLTTYPEFSQDHDLRRSRNTQSTVPQVKPRAAACVLQQSDCVCVI